MDDKNTREMLIGFMIFGIVMGLIGIVMKKNHELVKGTLKAKPKYEKIYKGAKYEFSIDQDTINKYDLRYVFSDLSSEQKTQILNEINIGDSIEMNIDRADLYKNAHEMYSLSINGKDIYELEQFKQLERREWIGSFSLSILAFINWLVFKFTRFKRRNFFIFIFQSLGLLAFIVYL